MHIAKRDGISRWKAWLIRGIAILLALGVCAIVTMIVTKMNPIVVFSEMIKGTFGNSRKAWFTIFRVATLLGISLAVTPAFKMRFWNIGAEGQVLAGALACAACMITLRDIPFFQNNVVMIVTMLIASLLAGAIWGFLPAIFKAKWNTNETLFTLMMNYIALQLVKFFIVVWEMPKGAGKIGVINANTELGWLPVIGGMRYLLPIIVVAVLTLAMYFYLKYSKQGYEIAVVGESERTARYAGIKVERVVVRTMILSGAICGLIGMLLVGGTDHTLTDTLVEGRGYTAVMVSWMSKFNPLGMVFSSFLLVFMQLGAKEVASRPDLGLNHSFADILTGIILFFIIGCEFFITYKLQFGRHKKQGV